MIHAIQADTLLKWAQLTPSEIRWQQRVTRANDIAVGVFMASSVALAAKICSALLLPKISILASLSFTPILTILVGAFVLGAVSMRLLAQNANWIEALARERGPAEIHTTGEVATQWSTSQKMTKIFDLVPYRYTTLINDLTELLKHDQQPGDTGFSFNDLMAPLKPGQESGDDAGFLLSEQKVRGLKFVADFKVAYAELTEAEKASLPKRVSIALHGLLTLFEKTGKSPKRLDTILQFYFETLRGALAYEHKSVAFTLFPEDIKRAESFIDAERQRACHVLNLDLGSTIDTVFITSLDRDAEGLTHEYVNELEFLAGELKKHKKLFSANDEQTVGGRVIKQECLRSWKTSIGNLIEAKYKMGLISHLEVPKLFFGEVAEYSPFVPEPTSEPAS